MTELPSEIFRRTFDEVTPGLRRFLATRLKQDSDIDDCLQLVFIAMLQHGGSVKVSAQRSWLFRVAANESARWWRSQSSTRKMLDQKAAGRTGLSDFECADPADGLIREETRQAVRAAIERLSPTYREVVRLRMHDCLTFQQIADQLNIPLGTVLTRMRRATDQLRNDLNHDTTL